MYQPKPSPRDRAATIALVLAIHAGLAFALINLSGPVRNALPEEVVEIFDVTEPPPPETTPPDSGGATVPDAGESGGATPTP